MLYIHRELEKEIQKFLQIFPVIAVTGPRQSGKSTLLKTIYKDNYKYVSFDDPLVGGFFDNDPQGFMKQHLDKVIFDEVQKYPRLLNYIKIAVDNDRQNYGKFILTGSSQFTLLSQMEMSRPFPSISVRIFPDNTVRTFPSRMVKKFPY